MKTPPHWLRTRNPAASFWSPLQLLLLLVLISSYTTTTVVEGLTIGRRRIQCSTPAGGDPETDALLDPRPNLPFILGFVGAQAFLPSLGQCPTSVQIQPPWFTGKDTAGGGLCPPEYIDASACLPGLAIIALAVAWTSYIDSNRLLITKKGIGTLDTGGSSNSSSDGFEETVLFSDVKDWFMTPIGLVVRSSSASTTNFFPLGWDSKSVEAVLEERI
mmetsp:Transcript_15279/g.31347  ORF Transcript_15279/g.31347 Transcript_15279/m.31347 type:complete len:217 (-) Transcript_15279:73-723(-)|eukprot:CAMPEP_0201124272 /NCGR_PEP_ID=MMETSP0850-20130426/10654_1 /ASSEMBLY_ACC=CAM_ASM_000622 /TAXON_ID=183588 /ORGANISM="Pseudo-nitzschia fraudulenta, Strain WWA7" /LENGTH=216 /DNA_ID=CAMNT_0047391483 /DNA_START=168 /DNA_END=818 /DNA_ORIENTATION=-